MKDSDFLEWIHERLVSVHGENDLTDYMWKLREVTARVRCAEEFITNIKESKGG